MLFHIKRLNQTLFFSDINTGKTLSKTVETSTSLKCFACIYYHWKKVLVQSLYVKQHSLLSLHVWKNQLRIQKVLDPILGDLTNRSLWWTCFGSSPKSHLRYFWSYYLPSHPIINQSDCDQIRKFPIPHQSTGFVVKLGIKIPFSKPDLERIKSVVCPHINTQKSTPKKVEKSPSMSSSVEISMSLVVEYNARARH